MRQDSSTDRQSDQSTAAPDGTPSSGGFWTESPGPATQPTDAISPPHATSPSSPVSPPPIPSNDSTHVIAVLAGAFVVIVLFVFMVMHPFLMLGFGLFLGGLLFLLAIPAIPLLILFWPEIVRRQQVIDRWDTLIAGGQGHADHVIRETSEMLTALELPQIAMEHMEIAPGIFKKLTGVKRPFLVVSQTTNFNLQPYRVYVNVRDYGESLQTSWYLTFQPGFLQRLRMVVLRRTNSLMLDLFDEQDLRAYVTAVHQCFIVAVLDLFATLGEDSSNLNRTSKGFLGIS